MSIKNDIKRIDLDSPEYPELLREISDPPQQLYCAGDISLLHEMSVSVVGSRKYTLYGKTVAEMVGRRLGECGVPVVSGLAYGIDAFAHEGALDAGGRVIGVLASGINRMAPKRNYDLMMRGLEKGGLVISEYEPDEPAEKYKYPRRNRIISGLGKCTAVIEANVNSGSLITAQHAMEQGRPVYAVPGNINSQFSIGCNLLIRDGAFPLVVIDDLVRHIGIDPGETSDPVRKLGEDERRVYDAAARYNGAPLDRLAEDTGMSAGALSAMVTVMEIKGIFSTYAGKVYIA
ncbi:MAG: DNA-processing protein DprA [Mogibacterium sp.]|nr:DNA-processing protein DprA [Mogibacterium sp.]